MSETASEARDEIALATSTIVVSQAQRDAARAVVVAPLPSSATDSVQRQAQTPSPKNRL